MWYNKHKNIFRRYQMKDLDLTLVSKRSRKDWRRERRRRVNKNFKDGVLVGLPVGILIGILLGVSICSVLTRSDTFIEVSAKSDKISTKIKEVGENEIEVEVERKIPYEELIAEHMVDNPASGRDRNTNMRQAAIDINKANNPIFKDGYILKPGEKFSWLEVVGNPTEERGYERAGQMENGGRGTIGWGGGVCQVAIAMNSAIQKTEQSLEKEKFHAEHHSGEVRYVKPERGDKELTITYEGGRDFWFISTLDYPIRIFIETQDDEVTVKIFAIKTRIVKEKKKIKKQIQKREP